MAMETRSIDSIKVGGRIRQDLGDLDKLAASIEKNGGLLQPVLIRSDGRLIAGSRRLAACKQAGRDVIEVNVRDDLSSAVELLIAERDENTCRKDFTPSEMVALAERLEELEKPKAAERKGGRPPKKTDAESAPVSPHGASEGATRDKVAKAVGVGRTKLTKAKEVVEAAEEGDPVAEQAREEMDQTGNVEKAHRKVASEPKPPPAVTNGKSKRKEINENAARQRLDKALIHIDGICDALADADLSKATDSAPPEQIDLWLKTTNRASKVLTSLKQTFKEAKS